MILPYLIAGLLIVSSLGKKPGKATSSAPQKGILYTCGKIHITDLAKFRADLIHRIDKYFEEKKVYSISKLDLLDLFGSLIKQYNAPCYRKILARSLTTQEKIATLLFISQILDILPEAIFKLGINEKDPYYQEYKQKAANILTPTVEWLAAGEEVQNVGQIIESFSQTYKYPNLGV
mgnify:CR=1 FL=1